MRDAAHRARGNIDQELIPDNTHDIVGNDAVHPRFLKRGANGASALGYAAVKLADKGILARNGSLHATRLQQHSADIGFTTDNMLGTDAIAQHVFCAKAVLQRHHRSVGANKPASLFHGLGGIERLAQNDDQVARPNAIWRGMTRKPYGFLSCRRYHNQAIFIDGIHVRSAPHEMNLVASFRQRTADGASQRASP